MNFNVDEMSEMVQAMLVKWVPSIIGAIIILIIGLWVIKKIVQIVKKAIDKKGVDPSLGRFLGSLISGILKLLLALVILDMIGVQATSFIAILGAAGLAIGMAMSGTLSNFAGGVMILLIKPFKVGDWIDAQGYAGTVREIGIFSTILKTPDNKTVIIPNAPLSTGAMVNVSVEPQRRVDFVFGIGYDDDIDKAKGLIESILNSDSRVLSGEGRDLFIAVSELADSSVNFVVRAWVNAGDYWGVHFDTIEAVKKSFDSNGVSIPYPQTDVHLHKVNG